MWYDPPKYDTNITDLNAEFRQLKGELGDEEAKITLAKFLRRNLGFTVDLLTDIKLYPDQLITIKGMLNRNYSLCVWGRGVSKTWTAAIYCILQCLFEPRTTIIVSGPTFRTARFIFNHIEKIVDTPEAHMLAACMGAPVKRNDEFKWSINGGEIIAIPLSGEKIRGFRATVLLIDEFLLMPEELVEQVLIPFLVAKKDQKEIQQIRAIEDKRIAAGKMKEEDRYEPPYTSKLVALSSASFKCEYLYKKYEEYVKQIYDDKMPKNGAKYFISQMAWDAIPSDRLDKTIIELAQSNQAHSATFRREYCAEFIDGSDSYFSMNKMLECSIKDGDKPTLLLKGAKDKKYLLAIDPNFSNSATADHFAMCVLELDDEGKMDANIVHQYAEAGKDLRDHIMYFHYILKNFNIEMIVIDHAGYQFIEAANESDLFKNDKIEIKIFEFSSEKDGPEYEEQLANARRNYNKQMQKIAFTQYFTSDFIRKANEWLQGCIDYKKIWFASGIKSNDSVYNEVLNSGLNVTHLVDPNKIETYATPIQYMIDNQEVLIKQTRYQCASIEVRTTVKGVQTFDLPQVLKRDTTVKRMRRDSYTALMLGCWLMKCYFDIKSQTDNTTATFEPVLI